MQEKKTLVLLALFLGMGGLTWVASGNAMAQRRAEGTNQAVSPANQQGENRSSMQRMMRSMMSGVVPAGVKPADLPEPGSQGAKLTVRYCAQCHDLPSPAMHSAAEWPAVANRMFQRMSTCSRMSGMGMMGNMGGMGMKGRMGSIGRNGMMGMMNIKVPSAQEQETIIRYLQEHSLKSIEPGALPLSRSRGAVLFAATCAQCHALPDPSQHTAQQWPEVVTRMRKNMSAMGKPVPDAATLRTITQFLQNASHAKP